MCASFDALSSRLHQAHACAPSRGGAGRPAEPGQACVAFAPSRPDVFRAVFRPDMCNPERFAFVQDAAARAHAELQRLTTIAWSGGRATPALTTILWAHVHGLACLLLDGPRALALAVQPARQAQLHEVAEQFADMILHPRPRRSTAVGHDQPPSERTLRKGSR